MDSRASTFFDTYAHDFSAIYGNRDTLKNRLVNRWFRRSMRIRYEMTLRGCEPIAGRSVIDVGCGPGHYAVALARRGAQRVLGVDFAPGMIELAGARARDAGVGERCEFQVGDFLERPIDEAFDYAVAMGVMDYVGDPAPFIAKLLGTARQAAFVSFPVAGGPLAWQRKLRYRARCDLYLYERAQLAQLFARRADRVEITQIDRDFFVAASLR